MKKVLDKYRTFRSPMAAAGFVGDRHVEDIVRSRQGDLGFIDFYITEKTD
jgi:hypothetical protein